MSKQKILSVTLLVVLLTAGPVRAQSQKGPVLLPKDLKLSLELLSSLNTKTSQKGDRFSCKVLTPAEQAGAIVTGHVRKAKSSGKATGKSEMDIGFDAITFSDGRFGSFNAQIVEVFDVVDAGAQGRADNEGTLKARSTVKRDAVRIGVSTAVGALIGGLLGGGQGAAIGAAIGAGIGVSTTLATKGPDLEFPQGTQLTVVLNGPSHLLSEAEIAKLGMSNQPPQDVSKPAADGPALTPSKANTLENTVAAKAGTATRTLPNPHLPSATLKVVRGPEGFKLSVPENWRESSSKNPVTFAPESGYTLYEGQPNLTHGVMIGTTPGEPATLSQATDRFVGAILKANPYLQLGQCKPTMVGSHLGLNCKLSGLGPATGKTEIVNAYTLVLEAGKVHYLITVVPEDQYANYEAAFQQILRSVQFDH
jgi:hypothetical protein